LELQGRKRELVQGMLDDDPGALGTATLEELRELLS